MIGKGFGKRFEAPSYEEGVGVDGRMQGMTLQKNRKDEIQQSNLHLKL